MTTFIFAKKSKPSTVPEKTLTAVQFIDQLKTCQSDAEQKKLQRYFKTEVGDYGHGDEFFGIKMGDLFAITKEFGDMPIVELEKLLESPIHEFRVGAVSIMDKASRVKTISKERLSEFFELYKRRHDRVNNWDLVDLGALNMTGRHLFDKSKDILYNWSISENQWERRSAIVSTCYFIRQNQLDDTFKIAEILVNDKEDLVNKVTGWMLRFAGDKNPIRLIDFLDKYAATMPRTLLRYSIEKLSKEQKEYFMKLKTK